MADDKLDGTTRFMQLDAQLLQDAGGYAFSFANETKQDMLSADIRVIKMASLFLCQAQHLFGPSRKFIVCSHGLLHPRGLIPPQDYRSYALPTVYAMARGNSNVPASALIAELRVIGKVQTRNACSCTVPMIPETSGIRNDVRLFKIDPTSWPKYKNRMLYSELYI